jgi:hypothetical protein
MRGLSGRPGIGRLCEGGHLVSRLRGDELAYRIADASFVILSPSTLLFSV